MERRNFWDVIVVGGGVAGCMAGFAAARLGARTLIVEKYGFLGGSLTNAGVGPMMTFHAGARQVVNGLPQEMVGRLIQKNASCGHIEDTTGYASSVTPFDAEAMKLVLDEMAEECGAELLFHATLTGVEKTEGKITAVKVQTRGGEMTLFGRVFVDASADGALSFEAGAKTLLGRDSDGLCQPMTANMKVSGVDIERLKAEIRANPENFNVLDLGSLDRAPRLSMAGFYKEFNKAKAEGLLSTEREDVLLFETANKGEVIVNTTRVIKLNPTDPWDLSRAEREGRRQAAELIRFFRKSCAGFENAVLISTGTQIGVRESRRVAGEYMLTAEDLLSSRHFEDTVALGGYPIDIHNPTGAKTETTHLKPGQFYYIPYRSLVVKDFANLLVAGRCLSATHEAGAAIRVTPIAMATGQAAGAAAALSVKADVPCKALMYEELKAALCSLGATVE